MGAHFTLDSTHLFVVRLLFQKVAKIRNFWKVANFCDRVNPPSLCTFILRFTYFCRDTLLDVGNWILTSSQPQRVVSGPDHLLDARKECPDNFVGVALRLTIIEPAARYIRRRN